MAHEYNGMDYSMGKGMKKGMKKKTKKAGSMPPMNKRRTKPNRGSSY